MTVWSERPHVAICYGSQAPKASVAEASELLNSFFNETATVEELFTLAGPNHTVQILLNSKRWLLLAGGIIATSYLSSVAAELGKRTPDAVSTLIEKVMKQVPDHGATPDPHLADLLARIVAENHANDTCTVFGYKMDKGDLNSADRNIGIEIGDASIQQIFTTAAVLGLSGQDVASKLGPLLLSRRIGPAISEGRNTDCSLRIATDGTTAEIRIGETVDNKYTEQTIRWNIGEAGR